MEAAAATMIMFMMLTSMLLPLFMLGFMIFGMFFWVWMIIDCATNQELEGNDKIVWVLVVVLTNWIGALIYFFAGRPKKSTITTSENTPPPIPTPPKLPPPPPII